MELHEVAKVDSNVLMEIAIDTPHLAKVLGLQGAAIKCQVSFYAFSRLTVRIIILYALRSRLKCVCLHKGYS